MKSILFDLDGTLVNSSPGIKAAFNYAFEKLQLPSQTDKQLSTFIGPPLEVTFGNYFDQTDDINHAIKTFRDYYGTKGIHQVSLYEGISDVLEGFKTHDRGKLIMACGTGKTYTYIN